MPTGLRDLGAALGPHLGENRGEGGHLLGLELGAVQAHALVLLVLPVLTLGVQSVFMVVGLPGEYLPHPLDVAPPWMLTATGAVLSMLAMLAAVVARAKTAAIKDELAGGVGGLSAARLRSAVETEARQNEEITGATTPEGWARLIGTRTSQILSVRRLGKEST